MDGNGLDGALGQQRAEREGEIGRTPHLLQRDRQRPGQSLSAMGGIEGHGVPAAGDKLAIGGGEALGRLDHAVFQPAAFAVARPFSGASTSLANRPPSSRIAWVTSPERSAKPGKPISPGRSANSSRQKARSASGAR